MKKETDKCNINNSKMLQLIYTYFLAIVEKIQTFICNSQILARNTETVHDFRIYTNEEAESVRNNECQG